MQKLKRRLVVALLVIAVSVGFTMTNVSAAIIPEVKIDQEPMYKTLVRVLSYVKAMYVEDVAMDKLLTGAIKGALSTLDPYSVYFGKPDMQAFVQDTVQGSFGGIGINIEIKDNFVTIVSPIKGTPADRAGLRAGDRILEVEGKSIKGVSTDTASNLIRGEVGTKVNLKVQKAGGEIIDMTITRAVITITSVDAQMFENGKVGYIKLHRFTMDTGEQLEAYIHQMKDNGVQGLIIDLRNNPGGLLSSAMDVLASMMPKGVAMNVVELDGKKVPINSGTDEKLLPTILLINGGSASASEVVAGAVKDYASAFIMGKKSFGKGSIQQIIDFPDGDGIKVTTAHYLTPYGNKIDGIGVTPDMEVEEKWPDPSKAPPYAVASAFKDGDKGPELASVERCLVALGYEKKATGQYGQAVKDALKAFQKDKGLGTTGILDADTASWMNQELAMRGLGGLDHQTWEALQMIKMKARIGW